MIDACLGLQDARFAQPVTVLLFLRRTIGRSIGRGCDLGSNVVYTHSAIIVAHEEPGHLPNRIVTRWHMIRRGCKCQVREEYGVIYRSM